MKVSSNFIVSGIAVYLSASTTYAMFYQDTVTFDTLYFLNEDFMGIMLISTVYLLLPKSFKLAKMSILSLLLYKAFVVVSEFLMLFSIFVDADIWSFVGIFSLALIPIAWIATVRNS